MKSYRFLNIPTDNETLKAFRLLAAKRDCSMAELGRQILKEYLEKQKEKKAEPEKELA